MTALHPIEAEILRIRDENKKRIRAVLAYLKAASPEDQALVFARNRVKRGFRWLAQHAPYPGWWRSCFNPDGRCRVNLKYAEDSVVTLAFEYEERFADSSHYVKDWMVLKHFFGPHWERHARLIGFNQHIVPYKKRFPDVSITHELLTRCWEERLRNPPGDWTIQHRHQTHLDRLLAADNPFGPPRGRFRRLLAGIPDALRGKVVA